MINRPGVWVNRVCAFKTICIFSSKERVTRWSTEHEKLEGQNTGRKFSHHGLKDFLEKPFVSLSSEESEVIHYIVSGKSLLTVLC